MRRSFRSHGVPYAKRSTDEAGAQGSPEWREAELERVRARRARGEVCWCGDGVSHEHNVETCPAEPVPRPGPGE